MLVVSKKNVAMAIEGAVRRVVVGAARLSWCSRASQLEVG